MAKVTKRISDMSGQEIEDGHGAKLRVIWADARRGVVELDVTDDEASQFKGRTKAKPGRKAHKAAATSVDETPTTPES